MKRQKKSAAELRVEREIRKARNTAKQCGAARAPITGSQFDKWADGAAYALKELRGK